MCTRASPSNPVPLRRTGRRWSTWASSTKGHRYNQTDWSLSCRSKWVLRRPRSPQSIMHAQVASASTPPRQFPIHFTSPRARRRRNIRGSSSKTSWPGNMCAHQKCTSATTTDPAHRLHHPQPTHRRLHHLRRGRHRLPASHPHPPCLG